jgi:two-component system cell cycle sensor histidine kinase/response regulator CckA
MAPETVARAFEPFYTTKGPSAGTGLGLAIVQGVLEQLGGKVSVQSRLGEGTCFSLVLPELVGDAATQQLLSVRPPAATQSRTVLLIEDDAGVRASITRQLESEGHTVYACNKATEALSTWRAQTTIELVISDVVLPGTTGPKLVREMLSLRALRVLFISGYLDDSLQDPLVRTAPFLAKPFSQPHLREKMAEALASPALSAEPTPK